MDATPCWGTLLCGLAVWGVLLLPTALLTGKILRMCGRCDAPEEGDHA